MALQLESRILWGTGLENVLAFDHPAALDNKRHWRRPAPGSVRARTSAGTTDASVTGYDYMLAGRARWFNDALWSGGPGIQEFLDWAGRGNVFRFVPDKNAPDFYIDNVTLDEPFEDPAPELEQADGSQALDIVLRNPTVDFGHALRGIMFEYAPGASLTDPVAATFSRASAATRRGLPGNLAAAIGATDAAGVLRDRHYEGALRTTLLEASRTQLVTDPENFGAWITLGTPVLTAGQADPFGSTGAYLVEDNDAADRERLVQNVSFPAGTAERAFAIFMRQGTSGASVFGIWDNTAVAWRHQVAVTWSGGTPALATVSGSGTRFPPVSWGGGWWLLAASAVGVIGANTNQFMLHPTDDVAASVGTTYVLGANAWNAPFPSSYQGPSLGTRNADSLSWTWPHKPQAMFVYTKYVEGGSHTFDSRIWSIGATYAQPGTFAAYTESNRGGTLHRGADGVERQATVSGSLVHGDVLEIINILFSDGSVQTKSVLNGASEAASGQSAASPLAAAWNDPTFFLNHGTGSNVGYSRYNRVKVGPLTFGGKTIDTIAKARVA